MATAQKALERAWHVRLLEDLKASDEAAGRLTNGLTEEQLNWPAVPGSWSIGQCLEHLSITNEAYLPAITAALQEKSDAPVAQIVPGWFAGWFIRNFVEPSPQTKRVSAPSKIRPASRVGLTVLDRFLSGNLAVRNLIADARNKDVNHIRFWNPFLKGIRFTVGTGLEIIAAHERRHLSQAERIRSSAAFAS